MGACCGTGFGILVLIVRRAYPAYLGRVLLLWGAANICLGASYLARFERAWAGEFVFNVVSQTLVAACLSIELLAVRVLKRQQVVAPWLMLPPALMFVGSCWFTFAYRNISIQHVIFNFINMTLLILMAGSLLKAEEGRRPFADVVTAIAYSVLALSTSAVIVDYFRSSGFTPEYNFNSSRSIFNNVAGIVTEGIVFPLFLMMVSERLNRTLEVQAMRDALTGLFNRRAFDEIAFREISGASRNRQAISVIMLDIDHFKQVNDEFGHAAGDAVLCAAAATLRRSLRDEDFLCRWGGDEFCALLPRARGDQAESAVRRILMAIEELQFAVDGKIIPIQLSAGIMTDEGEGLDFGFLVRLADDAMYRAKKTGRNRFAVSLADHPDPAPTSQV